MWDENAPLELLKEMPNVLTLDNLRQIQEVIDKDKYINSLRLNGDLCGKYAPFCDTCDKSVKYPCAVSYVKMMQERGLEVEISEDAMPAEEVTEEEERTESVDESTPSVEEAVAIEESPIMEEQTPTAKTYGKKIRIAIARKKS